MFINKLEKFLIEATILNTTDGSAINVSNFIKEINVRKDFVENSFPLFVVNFMTTESVRNIMRDNDVNLSLKVSKYTETDLETTEESANPTIDSVVLETVIRSYKKKFETTSSKTEDGEEAADSQSDTVQLIPFQIVGIPEELISKNATIINEVFENARMDDILVNIMSATNGSDRVYIDPSENEEREESLIIPPMNVVPAVKYLQDVYGVYKGGINVFLDLDRAMVYKIFNANRTSGRTFEVIVVPTEDVNNTFKFMTPQIDENENVRLFLRTTPPFTSNRKISEDASGQTTVFSSYDYNFGTVRRTYENETSSAKTRYFWNFYQNKLFEEALLNDIKQGSEITLITMSNVDPNRFSIDNLYTISTGNSNIDGRYSIVELSYNMFTNDYRHYNSIVSMKLTRIR
jgi:hypothetical protein